MTDPIHYHEYKCGPNRDEQDYDETGWYFWDETWANRYGPYLSREQCAKNLNQYCKEALGDSAAAFS